MKRFLSLIISVMLCRAMCSCTFRLPEPVPQQDPLPQIPAELFAVNEIAPECMEELQEKVAALTITDFLHPDRISRIETRGFALAAENISVVDCNEISFELVLTKKDGTSLRLPASGVLMYQYLPMNAEYIAGLNILWGNLGIYDNQIVFANIDTITLWNATTLQKTFRQPELPFITEGNFCFILDAIKDKAGYTITYYSKHENGFAFLSDTGRFINTQILNYDGFGTEKVMESRNFNTNFRTKTLLHTFYGDERQKQLFISCDYIFGYYGPDYEMFDFDAFMFTSAHPVIYYTMQDCEINVFGMINYNSSYSGTDGMTYIAVKKENNMITDKVIFKSDISPISFGTDTITGWNSYLNVAPDNDLNSITLGCRKTKTVMDIDFSAGTAQVYKSTDIPKMLGVDNSPNSQHMLYRGWAESPTPLVVRMLSGDCRMNWLTNVSGRWGVDWLAGFSTHKYIYVLTKNEFMIFRWEGSNDWSRPVHLTGNFDVNTEEAQRLCSIYA